eukprot:TRINITY_DN31_c0_g1_i1.p1 TRINITY_DN31_c0_g1~~TRINITY_DN31_c0_g1_i1.p1  ORF type:complete len:688 (+),score=150.25 TRINITY_DN31_c0_g1_i1:653-2716(+)
MEETNVNKIKDILKRPFKTLPFCTDLPRLLSCIYVHRNGGLLSAPYRGEGLSPAERQVTNFRSLILSLSAALNNQETHQRFEEQFPSYFYTQNGTVPVQVELLPRVLERFFTEVAGGDESPVVNVLKSCNQAAISPAIIELKFALGAQFMTKDVKDSWRIIIDLVGGSTNNNSNNNNNKNGNGVASPSSPSSPPSTCSHCNISSSPNDVSSNGSGSCSSSNSSACTCMPGCGGRALDKVTVTTTKKEECIRKRFWLEWNLCLLFAGDGMGCSDISFQVVDLVPVMESNAPLTLEDSETLGAKLYQYFTPALLQQLMSLRESVGDDSGSEEEEEEEPAAAAVSDADTIRRLQEQQLLLLQQAKLKQMQEAKQAAANKTVTPIVTPASPDQTLRKPDPMSVITSPRVSDADMHPVRSKEGTRPNRSDSEANQVACAALIDKVLEEGLAQPLVVSEAARPFYSDYEDVAARLLAFREELRKRGGSSVVIVQPYPNGDRYEGHLDDKGKRHGVGVYSTGSGGDVFVGEYVHGSKQGVGCYTFADGTRFEGHFARGQPNGSGHYKFANGDRYTGEFSEDEFHGRGRWESERSDVYVGQFLKGQRHGDGRFVSATGSSYDGEWQAGIRQGRGEAVLVNGDVYRGLFVAGRFEGRGVYTFASTGRNVEAVFQAGKPVKIIHAASATASTAAASS